MAKQPQQPAPYTLGNNTDDGNIDPSSIDESTMPDPTVMDEVMPRAEPALYDHPGTDNDKAATVLVTPDKIMRGSINSKEDLKRELQRYSHNIVSKIGRTRGIRRFYMEKIRPALRWYCRKYQVPVPLWLEGHGPYENLPPEEHNELFGDGDLSAQEFRTVREALKDHQGRAAAVQAEDAEKAQKPGKPNKKDANGSSRKEP